MISDGRTAVCEGTGVTAAIVAVGISGLRGTAVGVTVAPLAVVGDDWTVAVRVDVPMSVTVVMMGVAGAQAGNKSNKKSAPVKRPLALLKIGGKLLFPIGRMIEGAHTKRAAHPWRLPAWPDVPCSAACLPG